MQFALRQQASLGTALLSAAAFGTSGAFATALIDAGWSPAAAVTARLLVAAVVLTVPGGAGAARPVRRPGPRGGTASPATA